MLDSVSEEGGWLRPHETTGLPPIRRFQGVGEALAGQVEVDYGSRPGMTSQEPAAVKRLKAVIKRLRKSNEIQRRAVNFFAGELVARN